MELTEILGSDTIAGSRVILNNNFRIVKDVVNNITTHVDLSSKEIKNIERIVVQKGTTNTSETLISTNGSIALGGNLIATGSVSGSSLVLTGGASLGGDILLQSATNKLVNKGATELDGEVIFTDLTSNPLNAANELTFKNSQGLNNLVYDGALPIAGKLDVTRRNFVVVDWTNFISKNDVQYYLHMLRLQVTANTKVGQNIWITAKINEDIDPLPVHGSRPAGYWIDRDTLEYTAAYPLEYGIRFTKSYQSVQLVFNGLNWMVVNIHGAELI